MAAKAVQEKTGFDIEIVFNGYSFQWRVAEQLYASFGIKHFIYLERRYFFSNFWRTIAAWIVGYRISRSLRSPEDILRIEYDGIRVGDLIYDDVLKLANKKTIEHIDRDVIRAVAKSHYFFLQYGALFRDGQYEYYVSTHTAYSEYGILCRAALAQGVKVIETTDIQMSCYREMTPGNLPTYHDGIRNAVVMDLAKPGIDIDALRADAMASLQRRLASQVTQIDAEKAYRGKVYTEAELRGTLNLGNEGKIVFVLAHIFSDAPHLSSGMLHTDYYQWLQSTLRVCASSAGVKWIVKPHPSVAIYGEEGLVEGMVEELRSSSLYVCPADFNTRSLEYCADAVVTVHGTAGLEFSCLGIPAVLAGRPFYSGFGFTVEPASLAEYEHTLSALAGIAPLTEEMRERALEVYAIWERQFDWNNPIITTQVLSNVWGSGQPRNVEKAYELITNNLRVCDPRLLKLWDFAQAVVE